MQPPDAEIVTAEVVRQAGLNRKYFRPADLRRLSHQEFNSRRLAEGLFSGKHQTRQRGHSIEFQDYRQYIPGDPIQFLDWKVFGRTDKWYIKQFEHYADWTVHLLVDASQSMFFSGFTPQGDSKFDAACRLAAAVGFLVAKQHDRFSFSLSRDGLFKHLPARSGLSHLIQVLDAMEAARLGGPAGLATAVKNLLPLSKRRDVLCVLSDFLDSQEDLFRQLQIWSKRGGEVILFQIVHPEELELPDLGPLTLYDSETGVPLQTNLSNVRDHYREQFASFLRRLGTQATGLGFDHRVARTDQDYTETLGQYFARRQQVTRWQR